MKPQHLETITKAKQAAELLTGDIREAHSRACNDAPMLEILLRDLIGDAAKLQSRLAEIEAGLSSRNVPAVAPATLDTASPDDVMAG